MSNCYCIPTRRAIITPMLSSISFNPTEAFFLARHPLSCARYPTGGRISWNCVLLRTKERQIESRCCAEQTYKRRPLYRKNELRYFSTSSLPYSKSLSSIHLERVFPYNSRLEKIIWKTKSHWGASVRFKFMHI